MRSGRRTLARRVCLAGDQDICEEHQGDAGSEDADVVVPVTNRCHNFIRFRQVLLLAEDQELRGNLG